jgi:hypothetical protein
MPALAAWTPSLDRQFGVHAPALARSQVTAVERLIRPTWSVLMSGSASTEESVGDRARTVMTALGGQIEDPEVRRASGRVLMKHSRATEVVARVRGRLPRGF